MIDKHIMHIGFPRCGSSWLWSMLRRHPDFDNPKYQKENKIMFSKSVGSYYNFYKNYNVSANFNPNLWRIDSDLIKYISNYATHVSITLRNPYDFIERYYDFIGINTADNVDVFTNNLISCNYTNYYEICNRWKTLLNSNVKFKVFYFDDLQSNSNEFLSNYFTFCNLDATPVTGYEQAINQSVRSKRTTINFLDEHKKIINHNIDNFSNYTGNNLTHWKTNLMRNFK